MLLQSACFLGSVRVKDTPIAVAMVKMIPVSRPLSATRRTALPPWGKPPGFLAGPHRSSVDPGSACEGLIDRRGEESESIIPVSAAVEVLWPSPLDSIDVHVARQTQYVELMLV